MKQLDGKLLSKTQAENLFKLLKPTTAVIGVGFCGSLNHGKAKVGDVVVSSRIAAKENHGFWCSGKKH